MTSDAWDELKARAAVWRTDTPAMRDLAAAIGHAEAGWQATSTFAGDYVACRERLSMVAIERDQLLASVERLERENQRLREFAASVQQEGAGRLD